MLKIDAGRGGRYCDGLSRRSFLQIGVAGMANVGLPAILQARSESVRRGIPGKDTAVILVWLDGGPSHMDLYDMKPDAPVEYRGIWHPIRTNTPGIEVSELLPKHAAVADKFSLIRSLHHGNFDHFTAAHYILTSRGGPNGADTRGRNPSIGAVAARVVGPRRAGVPAHAAIPYAMSIGLRPGYFAGSYLGSSYNPFETDGDPNSADFKVNNMVMPAGLTIDRLESRRTLLSQIDRLRRAVDRSGTAEAMDRFHTSAYELVTNDAARRAFDLSSEDNALRDRYGRTTWGQSVLLARRLVEAGCTFVTCHLGGWDHHWNLQSGMQSYLPQVDAAVSTLLADLHDRGQLERTLVVVCGEFSRTPKMNDGGNGGPPLSMGTPGRDHWGHAMSCLVAGGGLQAGVVVGSTDRLGQYPKDRPLTPGDLHATIYHVLGIDPHIAFLDHAGRPVPAVDQGEPIAELV